MPAELAIGDGPETKRLLLLNDAQNLLVFDLSQPSGTYFIARVSRSRLSKPEWPQQAAYMIRAKGRLSIHGNASC
jgi:hypothetical protein